MATAWADIASRSVKRQWFAINTPLTERTLISSPIDKGEADHELEKPHCALIDFGHMERRCPLSRKKTWEQCPR